MTKADEYAKKLSTLVQCKTIGKYFETDLERFYDFHNVLREMFPRVFETCEFEDFNASFLLKWKGTDSTKAPIMFMNHHDVVEAGGVWEHEPFGGEIIDGKIHGRGTIDTKGGLFCMLQAAEELISEGFTPDRDIYFESACTEETDGGGAERIADELYKRGIHFEYTLDEGGLIVNDPVGGGSAKYAMVAVGEKGCAEIRFSAHSNGGHASRPGKNSPLVRLGKFMAAAERAQMTLFPPYCEDATKEMFDRISKKTEGPLKLAISNPYRKGWLLSNVLPYFSAAAQSMVQTTLAFTQACGSEAANVLPQEAWVMGNMRFSHHQGQKNSLDVIKKLADKYEVETEVTDPGITSKISDFKARGFGLIEKAISANFPDVDTVPYIAASASDNRYMCKVADNCYGIVPFVVSDEQLNSIHGLNENVDVKTIEPAVNFYRYLIYDCK